MNNAFLITRPNRSDTSLILSKCCLLAERMRSLLMLSASNVAFAIDSNEYTFANSLYGDMRWKEENESVSIKCSKDWKRT